ncbi:response regulator [Clostridium manihotivorum]|uniref:Stage 0 sporulation protein A homolog n=1 Tax=Clostridium manihotivorum TaxID=2320868 RepID=A0A410DW70_9CLOT|nr:response regulator [Clostridium manihotivorum]QAA33297.1 response regulator [Clostridium manihotivorum]
MKKVLIIDDTKNIRNMLRTCLEIRDYQVVLAENGAKALEIIESQGEIIDLIFLDIRMPGISGTEVLKELRGKNINCAVIIMTAFATVKNAIDCTKLGAFAYLQKPFSPERVNSVIDEFEDSNKANKDDINCEKIDLIEEVYIKAAKEQIDIGSYDEAFSNLKKALAINPYNKEIYKLISKVNEGIGDLEQAVRFNSIYDMFK